MSTRVVQSSSTVTYGNTVFDRLLQSWRTVILFSVSDQGLSTANESSVGIVTLETLGNLQITLDCKINQPQWQSNQEKFIFPCQVKTDLGNSRQPLFTYETHGKYIGYMQMLYNLFHNIQWIFDRIQSHTWNNLVRPISR